MSILKLRPDGELQRILDPHNSALLNSAYGNHFGRESRGSFCGSFWCLQLDSVKDSNITNDHYPPIRANAWAACSIANNIPVTYEGE